MPKSDSIGTLPTRQNPDGTDIQSLHAEKQKSYFTPSKSKLEEYTQTMDAAKYSMLYATQTDFGKQRTSQNLARDAHSRPSDDRHIGMLWLNDERVDRTDVDSELTKIRMPVYPIGPNLNNPTLPS